MNPAGRSLANLAAVDQAETLRRPVPGALWPWVKRASWIELGIFSVLVVFWLLPGFDQETFVFGLAHGIGYLGLLALIWVAVLRHEASYVLLAASLTPVGPLGSVISIEWTEHHNASNQEPNNR